jgi:hypothetical protein
MNGNRKQGQDFNKNILKVKVTEQSERYKLTTKQIMASREHVESQTGNNKLVLIDSVK